MGFEEDLGEEIVPMALHAVTVHLPAPLYDQLRRRAEDAHRSIEAELLDLVATALMAEEPPADSKPLPPAGRVCSASELS